MGKSTQQDFARYLTAHRASTVSVEGQTIAARHLTAHFAEIAATKPYLGKFVILLPIAHIGTCLWAFFILYGCYFSNNASLKEGNSISLAPDTSCIEFNERLIPPHHFTSYEGGSRIAESLIIRDIPCIFLEDCRTNSLHVYDAIAWRPIKIIHVPTRIDLCTDLHNFYTNDLVHFYFLSGDSEMVHFTDSDTNANVIPLDDSRFVTPYALDHFLVDHNVPYLSRDSMFYFQVESGKKVRTRNTNKRPYPTAALRWQDRQILYIGDRSLPHWSEVHYGLMDVRYQYYNDSIILYGSAFNAEIRTHDLETAQTESYTCRSAFDTLSAPPISLRSSRDAKWNHLMTNGYYGRIVYNPWKRCYYRFYYIPIPEKLPNGDFASMTDRRLSVMILSEDFNLIAERKLPDSCHFIYFASPLPTGLVINHGPVVHLDEKGLNLLEIHH